MHKRTSTCGVCVLAIVFVASATDLWAQDGQGYTPNYSAADPAPAAEMSSQPQMVAADQPKTAENAPPDYSALPPAQELPERGFGEAGCRPGKAVGQVHAKAAAAAKSQAPTKPLIAPSGRIQFDVANFSQNAASDHAVRQCPKRRGLPPRETCALGRIRSSSTTSSRWTSPTAASTPRSTQKDQSTAFKDVYIQVRELPVIGNVRVGHFKECFGLEQLTSDNYTTFMERSLDDEGAFVPGRNDGIMAYNWTENQRATWAIGAFTNQTGYDQPPTFVIRPLGARSDDACHVSALVRRGQRRPRPAPHRARLRLPQRPGPHRHFCRSARVHFAPSVVNLTAGTDRTSTDLTDVNDWQVVDGEAALVYGPLSFQSEFFGATVEPPRRRQQQLLSAPTPL